MLESFFSIENYPLNRLKKQINRLMKNCNDMVYDLVCLIGCLHFKNNRVLSLSRVRVDILHYCVKMYCTLVILLYGYEQYYMIEAAPILSKPLRTLLMMTLIISYHTDESQTVEKVELSDVISMHYMLQI
jgi:hypothetical protein